MNSNTNKERVARDKLLNLATPTEPAPRSASVAPRMVPKANSLFNLAKGRPTFDPTKSFRSNAFAQEAWIATDLKGPSSKQKMTMVISDARPAGTAPQAGQTIVTVRGFSVDRDISLSDGRDATRDYLASNLAVGDLDDWNTIAAWVRRNGTPSAGFDRVLQVFIKVTGRDANGAKKSVRRKYRLGIDNP